MPSPLAFAPSQLTPLTPHTAHTPHCPHTPLRSQGSLWHAPRSRGAAPHPSPDVESSTSTRLRSSQRRRRAGALPRRRSYVVGCHRSPIRRKRRRVSCFCGNWRWFERGEVSLMFVRSTRIPDTFLRRLYRETERTTTILEGVPLNMTHPCEGTCSAKSCSSEGCW